MQIADANLGRWLFNKDSFNNHHHSFFFITLIMPFYSQHSWMSKLYLFSAYSSILSFPFSQSRSSPSLVLPMSYLSLKLHSALLFRNPQQSYLFIFHSSWFQSNDDFIIYHITVLFLFRFNSVNAVFTLNASLNHILPSSPTEEPIYIKTEESSSSLL